MCPLLDEASDWAEKLFKDINLSPVMPDEHNTFDGSLSLDFRKMMPSRATQEYIKILYLIYRKTLRSDLVNKIVISKQKFLNSVTVIFNINKAIKLMDGKVQRLKQRLPNH